jgi:exonuclease SbcC
MHNSNVELILKQLDEYREQLSELKAELSSMETDLSHVGVLKKAFSTNGLVNYKVEYLVKDLETQINNYLADLSDGQFQLLFVLDGEKLNVEIVDKGKSVFMEDLSAGELAKINASTLLAIRKLMAAINSAKINILFLDEIMGVLDEHGKEKLIEVLMNETDLNTLLVSHEFSHPLIPMINIIKEDNISRIEDEI